MNEIKRDSRESCPFYPVRIQQEVCSLYQKECLRQNWPFWHPGVGLSSFQNYERFFLFINMQSIVAVQMDLDN